MDFGSLLSGTDRTVRDQLGESVLYLSGAGVTVSVRGLFDKAYQTVPLGEPGVASSEPAVFLGLVELSSNPVTDFGCRITARGVVYKPSKVEPDGMGGVLIFLHEV